MYIQRFNRAAGSMLTLRFQTVHLRMSRPFMVTAPSEEQSINESGSGFTETFGAGNVCTLDVNITSLVRKNRTGAVFAWHTCFNKLRSLQCVVASVDRFRLCTYPSNNIFLVGTETKVVPK